MDLRMLICLCNEAEGLGKDRKEIVPKMHGLAKLMG